MNENLDYIVSELLEIYTDMNDELICQDENTEFLDEMVKIHERIGEVIDDIKHIKEGVRWQNTSD